MLWTPGFSRDVIWKGNPLLLPFKTASDWLNHRRLSIHNVCYIQRAPAICFDVCVAFHKPVRSEIKFLQNVVSRSPFACYCRANSTTASQEGTAHVWGSTGQGCLGKTLVFCLFYMHDLPTKRVTKHAPHVCGIAKGLSLLSACVWISNMQLSYFCRNFNSLGWDVKILI